MKRRAFIAGLGSAAAWPGILRGQEPSKQYRIGLMVGQSPVMDIAVPAFRDELSKSGFIEGKNLAIMQRSNQQDTSRLLSEVAEVIEARADVVVAGGPTVVVDAVLAASKAIPIVIWANNYDPIEHGYVQNLARRGGRITGIFNRQLELAEKQVELLSEAFPERRRLGILWEAVSADQLQAATSRANALGLEVFSLKLEHLPYDMPGAFAALASHSSEMVLVLSTPRLAFYQKEISGLTVEQRCHPCSFSELM